MEKKVKKIVRKRSVNALSRSELSSYLKYRVNNLLKNNGVLTKRELTYLLCEVGPGKMRMDPELLDIAGVAFLIKSKSLQQNNDSKTKSKIEKLIVKDVLSSSIKDKISVLLTKCFEEVNRVKINKKTYYKCKYKDTPTIILIANGEWVMPDNNLSEFLTYAKNHNLQPIIIAKKVHGMLFPLFKLIGVLALSTYTVLLQGKTISKISLLEDRFEDNVKYREKSTNLDDLIKNFDKEYLEENFIKKFFNQIVPKYIEDVNKVFQNNETIGSDIEAFIKKVQKSKIKTTLKKWVKSRNLLRKQKKKNLPKKPLN
jgi:hypothetical protein